MQGWEFIRYVSSSIVVTATSVTLLPGPVLIVVTVLAGFLTDYVRPAPGFRAIR